MNENEIEYWFSTENGAHIPVKKGQSKEEALAEFLKDKGNLQGYSIAELKKLLMHTDGRVKSKVIHLPKKDYAGLCSAVRTRYADKIPKKGQMLYGDSYYQFRYSKRQERIVCTLKIKIEGNEQQINYYWEKFGNE